MNILNQSGGAYTMAAVLWRPPAAIDDLMASFALSLLNRGRRIRGVLAAARWQTGYGTLPALIDLDTCAMYGTDARGEQEAVRCQLQGVAHDTVDLCVFHRFPSQVATAAELLRLADIGVPILTSLHQEQIEDWHLLTGTCSKLLSPSLEAMLSWVEEAWRRRAAGAPRPQRCPNWGGRFRIQGASTG